VGQLNHQIMFGTNYFKHVAEAPVCPASIVLSPSKLMFHSGIANDEPNGFGNWQ
jgi:hypothetical protein